MNDNIKLGFSTGALFKAVENKNSDSSLRELLKISSKVIEISCLNISDLDDIKNIDPIILNQFEFKSFHLPALEFEYTNDKETAKFMEEIIRINAKYNFDAFVLHPDRVKDFNFMANYIDQIPLVIENMNSKKPSGRTLEELSKILDNYNFKLLMDLQHIHSNDKSMNIAKVIYEKYQERVVAFHISGESSNENESGKHLPLYKTNQKQIINSFPSKLKPIIIESPLESLSDLEDEYNYILKYITS